MRKHVITTMVKAPYYCPNRVKLLSEDGKHLIYVCGASLDCNKILKCESHEGDGGVFPFDCPLEVVK